MTFKPVSQKHKKVLIIGGGESLIGTDLRPIIDFDGAIVTVNSVILHLPRADYWVTGDLSKPFQALEDMREDCYYYAGYPYYSKGYSPVDGVHYLDKIVSNNYKLQEEKNKVTGAVDSIYVALNIAYHFEAEKIAILGMDCYGNGHWYDLKSLYNGHNNPNFQEDYLDVLPEKYKQCLGQFNSRGTAILNGSLKSRIDCFDRVTPQEAINWIKQ